MFPIPEKNVVKKDWRRVELKVGLCYPNIYRAGMSGLTVQLLYALLNSRDDVACERFFFPTEEESILSLESHQPLTRFDVIAFTFQYEEDYVNALKMLTASGIELDRRRRAANPLLIAGGPCITENPLPLSDFFDIFIIGELEPILETFVDGLKHSIRERTTETLEGQRGFLIPDASAAVRSWLRDLDKGPHPVAQVLPKVENKSTYMPVFGRTFTVEAVRGCQHTCSFCLISRIGRPMRARSLPKLEEIISEGIRLTGVNKVSLIGAGISYHPKLEEICEYVVGNGWEISVPSFNVEIVTDRLVQCLVRGGQRTMTFAPEAGSERLRKVVGKGFSNKEIIDVARKALRGGIKQIKQYFMVDLPTETEDDVEEIVHLSKQIADIGFGKRGVRLSVNPMIPKPYTPFQFSEAVSPSHLKEALDKVKRDAHRDARLTVDAFNVKHAHIQDLLSRGSENLGFVLRRVAEYGGSLGSWRKALGERDVDFKEYVSVKEIGDGVEWQKVPYI
jgi:radical SAM superfamily enzyme YgiQ (UPF0313 family)